MYTFFTFFVIIIFEVINMQKKKDYIAVHMKLDRTVHERLERYAKSKGLTKTKAAEILITKSLDQEENKE